MPLRVTRPSGTPRLSASALGWGNGRRGPNSGCGLRPTADCGCADEVQARNGTCRRADRPRHGRTCCGRWSWRRPVAQRAPAARRYTWAPATRHAAKDQGEPWGSGAHRMAVCYLGQPAARRRRPRGSGPPCAGEPSVQRCDRGTTVDGAPRTRRRRRRAANPRGMKAAATTDGTEPEDPGRPPHAVGPADSLWDPRPAPATGTAQRTGYLRAEKGAAATCARPARSARYARAPPAAGAVVGTASGGSGYMGEDVQAGREVGLGDSPDRYGGRGLQQGRDRVVSRSGERLPCGDDCEAPENEGLPVQRVTIGRGRLGVHRGSGRRSPRCRWRNDGRPAAW